MPAHTGNQARPRRFPGRENESWAQEQRVPGKMTREEARQLLDTLKDGEKKLPAANLEKDEDLLIRSGGMLKDW